MSHTGQLLVEVQQVDHLLDLRKGVTGPDALRHDVSLRNDLLFGLLNLSRAAAEIAAVLSDHRGVPYDDPPDALRRVDRLEAVPDDLAARLTPFARLAEEIDGRPATTEYGPVIDALYELEPVQAFARFAAGLGLDEEASPPDATRDQIAPRPGAGPPPAPGDDGPDGSGDSNHDAPAGTATGEDPPPPGSGVT